MNGPRAHGRRGDGRSRSDGHLRPADSGESGRGSRQVDGAIGALDALPTVIEVAGGQIPVLFDSGVRSGADIFKAFALGATAVLLGRPYVYGLAIAGQLGVQEVIRNVPADLDLTMGLCGCCTLEEIMPEMLRHFGRLEW